MDILSKAAAKGEALRRDGWDIKAVYASKNPPPSFPDRGILILRIHELNEEQIGKITSRARGSDNWLVLLDFGKGYVNNGWCYKESIDYLTQFLTDNPPIMVWEATSERKARQAKGTTSSRQSGT